MSLELPCEQPPCTDAASKEAQLRLSADSLRTPPDPTVDRAERAKTVLRDSAETHIELSSADRRTLSEMLGAVIDGRSDQISKVVQTNNPERLTPVIHAFGSIMERAGVGVKWETSPAIPPQGLPHEADGALIIATPNTAIVFSRSGISGFVIKRPPTAGEPAPSIAQSREGSNETLRAMGRIAAVTLTN